MPADRLIHPKCGHSEKCSKLSDLEFRVWVQFILSADDFGVMRASVMTLQDDSYALAGKPQKAIQKALDTLIDVGLLGTFTHQGRTYVWQRDWHVWQKVSYPRGTNLPKPDDDVLKGADETTRLLFALHPGGKGRKFPKNLRNDLGTVQENSGTVQESSEGLSGIFPTTRAGAPADRLMAKANGNRLTANGSEKKADPISDLPPMDVWARELVNLYPPQGRCGWNLVERPLFAVLSDSFDGPTVAWERLKARLEEHKRSYQWRVKAMIPRLDKWLREGLYLAELPERSAEELTPKTNRTLQAAASIMRGDVQ